jgi:hypothetical protein
MRGKKKSGGKFRLVDFLVILLCLSGAAYSVNLFWNDLFQTLNGRNKTPVGTVTVKRNIVQRRMSDRVIWDRLIKEAPVYSNDIIRVGDNSEIDLHVVGNGVTINENTLLRLRHDNDTGELHINLTSGSIGLVTDDEGGGVVLNIMGKQMKANPGTALNAAAGGDGVSLQVSKGSALIADGTFEIGAGAAITMDREGSIRSEPSVFVTQPRPNALYRKRDDDPLNVVFSWNRINLQPDETLRLEIAEDRNFSLSVRTLNGLNDSAQAGLSAGLWNWRLIYNGAILASGRFTVTEAERFELVSPARNRQFAYETEPPTVYFQWSQMEDVSYYIAEVDVTPEFRNPIIKRQMAAASFSDSSLGEGIWYWRVTPVFSQTNEAAGGAYGVFASLPSAFRIVKNNETQAPSLTFTEEPAPVPTPPPAPEPAPAPTPAPPPPPPSPRPAPAPLPKPVMLESPSNNTTLPGLTAIRQQTVFRWSSNEAVAKSRFVLSHNPNPLAGQAVMEILDPNRTIRIDRLDEGIWYWTVEAQTPEGVNITAQTPRQLRVLPIPLLPAPSDRQPAEGYRIGIEELKQININFMWSAVQGANSYIFTLYQETNSGRRQIARTPPENRTSWSTVIKTLGRGNFIWRVEAVSVGHNNEIEQRGNPVESRFVIDIPPADPVKIISGSVVKP